MIRPSPSLETSRDHAHTTLMTLGKAFGVASLIFNMDSPQHPPQMPARSQGEQSMS